MAEKAEEWKEKVHGLLKGINRYNPEIIATLEGYVEFQAKGDCYDFEANLALLKLYQFRPACVNKMVAALILLKALAQMPNTHFITLKCILGQSLQNDPAIHSIVNLHSLLECCQFKSFWLALDDVTETVEQVADFKHAIRKYICSIVDISYQSIPLSQLQEYVGGDMEQEAIAALVAECGWSLDQELGVVSIRQQEANIRPKKILAKIDFEMVSEILKNIRTVKLLNKDTFRMSFVEKVSSSRGVSGILAAAAAR